MKLGILLGSALALAACASHNTPPAASSDSVAEASNTPTTGPDFAPAATDGVSSAPTDARRDTTTAGQAPPTLTPPPEQTASTRNFTNSPVNNGAQGDASANPATGNAAAMPVQSPPPATEADNSRINKRDRNGSTLTPMDQGGSEADRKLTQQIRQAVVKDSALSFTAKNVKIITINGKVTLRGPVKSDPERAAVEADARKVAGGAQIDNFLEIAK